MKSRFTQFNIYLLFLLVALLTGCQTDSNKNAASQKKTKPEKLATTIQLYLEVNPDGTDRNGPVQIYRASPVEINVNKNPFLDTTDVDGAAVVDVLGGFSIKVQFSQPHGARVLEQVTTSYRGQRIAVFCQFGDARWLAATG